MRRWWVVGAALALAAAGCSGRDGSGEPPKTLLVYCGGTMRQPMEVIATAYREKTGVRVDLSFGDTGTLLIQIEQRKEGDGFVAHDPFATMAQAKGLVTETRALATMEPVIGVKVGTRGAQEIKELADLAKPGLRIGVPDPEKSTAGQILAAILRKTGRTAAVMKNAVLVSRASGDLVNALSLGSVDAVVAWDALVRRDGSLHLISITERLGVDAITSATGKQYRVARIRVTLSTLKSSKDAKAAAEFLGFAAGPAGRAAFEKFSFSAPE